MAYALYTQSLGSSYANAEVIIRETSTSTPATILSTASGGFLNDRGWAKLDGSGNLSVYIDTARTWTVSVVNPVIVEDSLAVDTVFITSDQVPTYVGKPGFVYVVKTAPYLRYKWNGSALVLDGGTLAWGNIAGTVTNQTDIVNYVNAQMGSLFNTLSLTSNTGGQVQALGAAKSVGFTSGGGGLTYVRFSDNTGAVISATSQGTAVDTAASPSVRLPVPVNTGYLEFIGSGTVTFNLGLYS